MKRDQSSECGGCGSGDRFFLFDVRHRATYRRLCTSCVLKFHPGSFCPVCFQVYDDPPAPHHRIMCNKCPSVSHLSCLRFDIASTYECPSCANPSFLFFDSSKKNDKIDLDSAKVLLAAARIASMSMNKAAAMARVEAEKRVKESTFARKRAKEALERVYVLAARDSKPETDQKMKFRAEIDASVRLGGEKPGSDLNGKAKIGAVRALDIVSIGPESSRQNGSSSSSIQQHQISRNELVPVPLSVEPIAIENRPNGGVQSKVESNGLVSVPPAAAATSSAICPK